MPVDAALSEALAPVLRDLENSGMLLPDILDEQEQDFDGRVYAMLYGPDVPQRAAAFNGVGVPGNNGPVSTAMASSFLNSPGACCGAGGR